MTDLSTDDLLARSYAPSAFAAHRFNKVRAAHKKYQEPVYLVQCPDLPRGAVAMACARPAQTHQGMDRFVVYSPYDMTEVDFASGSRFVTQGILAHELGHHVYNHTIPDARSAYLHSWDCEFEADYYSGWILARLGAKPEHLFASQRVTFNRPSKSHPGSYERIEAVYRGWRKGGGRDFPFKKFARSMQSFIDEQRRWFEPTA